MEGYEFNWKVKTLGDPQTINLVGADEGNSSSYQIFVIKSMVWPGSVTITNVIFNSV